MAWLVKNNLTSSFPEMRAGRRALPPYPEGAPLLFSFHLAAAARRQALNAGAGCDGSECCLMQMPQLVGVPDHIDCRDLSVLDVECSRLKFAVGLHGDESRQSVDETGTNKFRAILPEKVRQSFMDLHDGIEADDWLHGCRTLATAVGHSSSANPLAIVER